MYLYLFIYTRPLALPGIPDAPFIPSRDFPFNPFWKGDETYTDTGVCKLPEKHGPEPFYQNQSDLSGFQDFRRPFSLSPQSKFENVEGITHTSEMSARNAVTKKQIPEPIDGQKDIGDFGKLKPKLDGIVAISNAHNQILAPENSGVRVIFPKECSPVAKYHVKCKVISYIRFWFFFKYNQLLLGTKHYKSVMHIQKAPLN